jgi:hypothetical protein
VCLCRAGRLICAAIHLHPHYQSSCPQQPLLPAPPGSTCAVKMRLPLTRVVLAVSRCCGLQAYCEVNCFPCLLLIPAGLRASLDPIAVPSCVPARTRHVQGHHFRLYWSLSKAQISQRIEGGDIHIFDALLQNHQVPCLCPRSLLELKHPGSCCPAVCQVQWSSCAGRAVAQAIPRSGRGGQG